MRKCEICKLKSGPGNKGLFFAKFPKDEERCKEWVRVTGNEDLAYIPIEKLTRLKFVCQSHFTKKDYCRRKTMLKKTAIPSLNLTCEPLSEDILADFPLHVSKDMMTENRTHEEHSYFNNIPTRESGHEEQNYFENIPTSGSPTLDTGHESPTLDTSCENGNATSETDPTQEKCSPSESLQNTPRLLWDYSDGILQLILFPVEPGCIIRVGAQEP